VAQPFVEQKSSLAAVERRRCRRIALDRPLRFMVAVRESMG
jgi:hypothetical protein